MAPGLVLVLIIFMIRSCLVSAVFAEDCPRYFNCEGIGELYFPFTNSMNPECGGLYVRGCGEQGAAVEVRLGNENQNSTWFEIERIPDSSDPQTLLVKDRYLEDLRNSPLNFLDKGNCSIEGYNITLPPSTPLMSFKKEFEHTLTLFFCNKSIHVTPSLFHNGNYYTITDCGKPYADYRLYYGVLRGDDALPAAFNGCRISQVPAKSTNVSDLESSYAAEFYLTVVLSEDCRKCFYDREGHCRVNDTGDFSCVFEVAEQGLGLGNVLTVTLAASTAMVTILVVLRCCFRRKVTPASIFFWKGENPIHQKIDIFLKNHEFLQTKRYTYSQIREMTNSFKNKLGQGGYGSVYKGKLPDGRLVAVKVLNKLKGNGEEFINEVATISQTSHVNVVSLFGFCFQGSKRALVYEFMPNGSLEKFIYEDNAAMVDRQLDCKTLHDIAIGTARGLEYLHRGCNTRILHFDIKPHNILLDVDFCPKISDFGLAKICPRKESIVSMLGARGTAGYIAPEVFSRNFGGVSHKSDVYSFGMMVLEMVGGRKNINVEVECSSEIYFPHWIYKCLEQNQQLALRCIKNENDNEMVRKMILVSLWCIQTDPSARPAMSKVVEMLEGSLESLQIPPKPFLSSPKSSPVHCSISTCETVSVIT